MSPPRANGGIVKSGSETAARRVLLSILLLVLCNFVIRLAISPNLEWDEAEFVGHTELALGYPNSHPPLLNWIVSIVLDATGNWVAAWAIPKHLLLAGTYVLVFDTVRRVTGRGLAAALAAASLLLIPEIVFYSEYTRTHAVLVTFAAAASLHAVAIVAGSANISGFIWLGAALSVGLLAKYNFPIFVVALALGVAVSPQLRRTILVPRLLVTLGIVAALVTPHLVWLMGNIALATERLEKLDRVRTEAAWFDIPGVGLDGFLTLVLCLAAWAGLLVAIWGLGRRLVRREDAQFAPGPIHEAYTRLLGFVMAFGTGLLALLVLALDLHDVRVRYVSPFMMAFPIWLALRWPLDASAVAVRRFLATALSVGAVATLAWPIAAMSVGSPYSFPFVAIADAMKASVRPPLAIWSGRRELSANLAIRLPGVSLFDPDRPADSVLIVARRAAAMPEVLTIEPGLVFRASEGPRSATAPGLGFSREPQTLSWRLYRRCPDCSVEKR